MAEDAPARRDILPEADLPDAAGLIADGRALATAHAGERCAFLDHYGVASEAEFKRQRAAAGEVMLHAQIGYRDREKSRRAYGEIYERLAAGGHPPVRYGICLDWSMGYPRDARRDMPRGTGLILDGPEDFRALTAAAPVAPHFGDFVLGTPAAVENTRAALAAGSTVIGNIGQYFAFRMPVGDDDVATTRETVRALALIAAHPREVLVHSNLDDGFAALFCDMACALGAVLIERHAVETLIGAPMAHCYGHTYSDPAARLAFQRALAAVCDAPGSMIYGNTTSYGTGHAANYAALGRYLLVDVIGQRTRPTGHAVNPVPVTEAERIPDVGEIVDALRFAGRVIDDTPAMSPLFAPDSVDAMADRIVAGGRAFRDRVLDGLAGIGIDTDNPMELLLAIRRLGARRLEELYGPGTPAADRPRGRRPVQAAATLLDLEAEAEGLAASLDPKAAAAIGKAGFTACVATTDVHEYGKILLEGVLRRLHVRLVDGGVSSEPGVLAKTARSAGADLIAVSSYNGVAPGFIATLNREMKTLDLAVPVFVGGRLNVIPEDSNTSLPVDAGDLLRREGAIVCRSVEEMLRHLAEMAAP